MHIECSARSKFGGFLNAGRFAFAAGLLALAGSATAQTGVVPSAAHPGFDLINFRPANLQARVTGIDWLSDGRMVFSHWGGNQPLIHTRQMNSVVYIVNGASGDNPTNVTYSIFADGLEDVMGLRVVNDRIFICGGNDLIELVDANKDGKAETKRVVMKLPGNKARHEFLFGLLYRDGTFYMAASSAKLNLQPEDSTINPNRGTLLAVNETTGQFTIESMGLRTPNGLSFGPQGEIFVTDVQGNWLPSCKLIRAKKGAFYGFKHTPRETWDNMTETPPAVYIPQTSLGLAPGTPLLMKTGPYAGQFLIGDVSHGGIQRYSLEVVKGEYQGAGFHFLGGFESGVKSLAMGPDGHIYVGGIGGTGNWAWNEKQFGFQKLKPNGNTAFEMLAIRSLSATAMEIEFTEALAAGLENTPANFVVSTWYYTPTGSYGGGNVGTQRITVSGVTLSADRKIARLTMTGLSEKRVVNIKVNSAVKSASGKNLWTPEAWYTLNAFGPGTPVQVVGVEQGKKGHAASPYAGRGHGRAFGAVENAVWRIGQQRDALGRAAAQ
jgi:glucose/arabinose dehydrogenase